MNLQQPIPRSFETERLHIRRYESNDKAALFEAARASVGHVFEFLPWCHPDYAEEDAASWLEMVSTNWKEGRAFSFAIFNKDQSEFLGGCGINRFDEHPVGNLGYWVKSGSTGRGIATEATLALAAFGIHKLGLQRIEIVMAVDNIPSRGVAEAAGAQFEGLIRNRLLLHDRVHNAYLYSITPEDLTSSRK